MRETLPMTEYPPFLIGCEACGKEPGQHCTTWEGAPCACIARVKASERVFGRYRCKGKLYLRITLAERVVGNCLDFLSKVCGKASYRMDKVVHAWANR